MASNYKTSAGTDLDDIFAIDNSNLGALGFIAPDGKDLGNRYTSGSLGYDVGYKNSAGTDIGQLRGNTVTPTQTVSHTASSVSGKRDYVLWDDGESSGLDYYYTWVKGAFSISINPDLITGSSSIKCSIQGRTDTILEGYYDINVNSSKIPSSANKYLASESMMYFETIHSWNITSNTTSCGFYWTSEEHYDDYESLPAWVEIRFKIDITSGSKTNTYYTDPTLINCPLHPNIEGGSGGDDNLDG